MRAGERSRRMPVTLRPTGGATRSAFEPVAFRIDRARHRVDVNVVDGMRKAGGLLDSRAEPSFVRPIENGRRSKK